MIAFKDATADERRRWQDALELLIRKIMVATHGKRVIVKSCPHSARIPMILERFPNAKFVHIHRHPARVFTSMMHMRSVVDWENFFQRPTVEFVGSLRAQTAQLGQVLFSRIVEDRALIPKGNLVELDYDEVCGREREVVEGLYRTLGLPTWDTYAPVLDAYLAGLKGFKRNALALDDELQGYVYDNWRIMYDTYGYRRSAEGYL